MKTEVTVEEAQENLLRKRAALGIQEKSSSTSAEITQKIIGKLQPVDESVHCFLHKVTHPCPLCHEVIEEEQREQERRKERERLERKEHPEPIMSMCGVGKAMLGCSFESFQGAEKTKALLRKCIEEGESILLKGNTGTGKTHLAISTLRELVADFKVNSQADACVITVPELLLEIRSTYNNDRYSEKDVVDKYSDIPYLILDDLGAEKSTDFSITTLYIIIDSRYREMLPTIYTTNLSLPEIEQHLSPRIASRMSTSKVITLDLPDYRLKRTPLKVAQHV